MKRILRIGIMSEKAYRRRTLAIARGEYVPKEDEPKIWFESLQSMAQVLSQENRKLLEIILRKQPQSLTELEALTGRKKSNLSRTLKTLARYGIVTLHKRNNRVVPEVNATHFQVEFGVIDEAA